MAAGGSAALGVVVGLVWFALTEAAWTRGDSPALPQPTRVYLYLAMTLLAAVVVVLTVVARSAVGPADPARWSALGETLLGQPLFLAVAFAGLASSLVLSARLSRADAVADHNR